MFIYKQDTHTHTQVSLECFGNLGAGLPPDSAWAL